MTNLTRTIDPTGERSRLDLLEEDINNLLRAVGEGKVDFTTFNETLIIPDANGIPNVLLGPRPGTTQRGLFIAKAGISVITADDDNLIFNSLQNVFKIVQRYTLSVDPTANPPGTYNSYSDFKPHNLGSPRVIYGFVDSSLGGRTNLPHSEMVATGAPGSQVMNVGTYKWAEVDNNNVTARVETTTPHFGTYTFTVYLLQETAS